MKDLKQMLVDNGGFTLTSSLEDVELRDGYMVAYKAHENIIDINSLELGQAIQSTQSNAEKLDAFAGGWLDNGLAYLDVSKHFTDKNKALEFARQEKQIAIYDIEKGESIYL